MFFSSQFPPLVYPAFVLHGSTTFHMFELLGEQFQKTILPGALFGVEGCYLCTVLGVIFFGQPVM